MAGKYIKVYLDETELAGLEVYQWSQASKAENASANYAIKEALKSFLLGHGIMEVKQGPLTSKLVVKSPAELGLEPEKHGALAAEKSHQLSSTTGGSSERRKGSASERVRRSTGTDPAGSAHADGGGAGQAGASSEPGGRRGQRRRRPGARAARVAGRGAE